MPPVVLQVLSGGSGLPAPRVEMLPAPRAPSPPSTAATATLERYARDLAKQAEAFKAGNARGAQEMLKQGEDAALLASVTAPHDMKLRATKVASEFAFQPRIWMPYTIGSSGGHKKSGRTTNEDTLSSATTTYNMSDPFLVGLKFAPLPLRTGGAGGQPASSITAQPSLTGTSIYYSNSTSSATTTSTSATMHSQQPMSGGHQQGSSGPTRGRPTTRMMSPRPPVFNTMNHYNTSNDSAALRRRSYHSRPSFADSTAAIGKRIQIASDILGIPPGGRRIVARAEGGSTSAGPKSSIKGGTHTVVGSTMNTTSTSSAFTSSSTRNGGSTSTSNTSSSGAGAATSSTENASIRTATAYSVPQRVNISTPAFIRHPFAPGGRAFSPPPTFSSTTAATSSRTTNTTTTGFASSSTSSSTATHPAGVGTAPTVRLPSPTDYRPGRAGSTGFGPSSRPYATNAGLRQTLAASSRPGVAVNYRWSVAEGKGALVKVVGMDREKERTGAKKGSSDVEGSSIKASSAPVEKEQKESTATSSSSSSTASVQQSSAVYRVDEADLQLVGQDPESEASLQKMNSSTTAIVSANPAAASSSSSTSKQGTTASSGTTNTSSNTTSTQSNNMTKRRSSSVPVDRHCGARVRTTLDSAEQPLHLAELPEELLGVILEYLHDGDKYQVCVAAGRQVPQAWGVVLLSYSKSLQRVQELCEQQGVLTDIASEAQVKSQLAWQEAISGRKMLCDDVRRWESNPARFDLDLLHVLDDENQRMAQFQAAVQVLAEVMARWSQLCKKRDDTARMCSGFHNAIAITFAI